jgi:hypothetical protein
MTVGVAAALAVGEWPVAAVVVLFMHTASYAERFTADGPAGRCERWPPWRPPPRG